MITIVDYKTGNLGSIKNMLKKIGEDSMITSDPELISVATKIILPGVGSFDAGVHKLNNAGLWDILIDKVENENTPILGICLGAQLMTKGSEEGIEKGFGWIDAETVRFKIDKGSKLKVPNMGWNSVEIQKPSKLFSDLPKKPRFYFVHSYHFSFKERSQVLTISTYSYEFASSFEKGNILGVQFHPEKSHKYGMSLLKNFATNY